MKVCFFSEMRFIQMFCICVGSRCLDVKHEWCLQRELWKQQQIQRGGRSCSLTSSPWILISRDRSLWVRAQGEVSVSFGLKLLKLSSLLCLWFYVHTQTFTCFFLWHKQPPVTFSEERSIHALQGKPSLCPDTNSSFFTMWRLKEVSACFMGCFPVWNKPVPILDNDPHQKSEVFSGWKHFELNPPKRKKPSKSTFRFSGAPLWTSVRNVGSCPQSRAEIFHVHMRLGFCRGHDLSVFSAHQCVSVFSVGWG